jgi:5-methyltetrahydrofolate--homocysteine methyltransferase
MMGIDFSPERWNEARRNYRSWWAGELKRPLISFTLYGYEPGRPEPKLPGKSYASYYDPSVPVEEIVDRWDYDLSGQQFLADGFPSIWPNFGPGVIASFLGCALRNGENANTVWFKNESEMEIADVHLKIDPDAFWFRRLRDLVKAASDRWQGLVQVSMTDLGGNLDILSSFRPGENLLLDLYDNPDEVKRVTWEAHKAWWYYFDELNKAMHPPNPGYSAWTPIFSEEPYYILQCDFAYMIGPEMFDEFVKPEIAASCRRLKNSFYHLDGVGQLPHLDSLLSIPELKGIQWVPGDGKPDVSEWPDVYRRIRKAGKLIHLLWSGTHGYKIMDVVADQLGSAEGIIFMGGIHHSERNEAEKFLSRYL